MRTLSMIVGLAIALVLCEAGRAAPVPAIPRSEPAPAGAYTLDKAHASMIFRIDHLGFSRFTTGGTLLGMELRWSGSQSGKYTIDGSGLDSWVFLFRIGS